MRGKYKGGRGAIKMQRGKGMRKKRWKGMGNGSECRGKIRKMGKGGKEDKQK